MQSCLDIFREPVFGLYMLFSSSLNCNSGTNCRCWLNIFYPLVVFVAGSNSFLMNPINRRKSDAEAGERWQVVTMMHLENLVEFPSPLRSFYGIMECSYLLQVWTWGIELQWQSCPSGESLVQGPTGCSGVFHSQGEVFKETKKWSHALGGGNVRLVNVSTGRQITISRDFLHIFKYTGRGPFMAPAQQMANSHRAMNAMERESLGVVWQFNIGNLRTTGSIIFGFHSSFQSHQWNGTQ